MAGLLNDAPFQWGVSDCVLFMADYIAAKTGTHPAPEIVGSYSTAFGARKIIMRAGGLVNLVSGYMGQFSDGTECGVYSLGGVRLCGVSDGTHTAFKTENGVMITTKAKLIKGWDI